MNIRRSNSILLLSGAALAAVIAPALGASAVATATLVRVNGARYTLDAGRAEGLSIGQEAQVLKNGAVVGRLRVNLLRDHEADAAIIESLPNVIVRVGDTVTYEPGATAQPAPPVTPPIPPVNPTSPVEPTPVEPTPVNPTSPASPPVTELSPSSKALTLVAATPEQAELNAELTDTLVGMGLENIFVATTKEGGLYVEFENRRWRWEVDAIGAVLRALADSPARGPLTVVGKQRGVPAYQAQTSVVAFRDYLSGSLSDEEFRRQLRVTWPELSSHGGASKSFGRVDATLGQGIRGDITSYAGQSAPGIQERLRLGLQTDLFKGLRVQLREWVPLNSVSNQSKKPTTDVGEVTYVRRFGPKLYAEAGAGTFREGYGAMRGTINLFPATHDALALDFGRVGRSLGDLKRFAYLGTWRHQLPHVDAQVFARGGRFLSGDTGGAFGFSSQFRQRSYEFIYTKTNTDKLLTFQLRWPLGGSKFSAPKPLRLRREQDFGVSVTQKGSNAGRTFNTNGWTENWQIATMPAILPKYVAFLKGSAAEGGVTPALQEEMRDIPLSAITGPSLSGTTGLWFVPAAEVEPYGYWTLGANWVDQAYRKKSNGLGGRGTVAEYLTLGILPRTEVTLRLTNLEGRLGVQRYNLNEPANPSSSGWNVDKEISAQYLLMAERGSRPALAFGAQDFAGSLGNVSKSVLYKAYYGVASKTLGRLTVHAGIGTNTLKGLFFGADHHLTPRIRILADYARDPTTPKNHKITLGVRAEALKNIRVDLYANGLKKPGAGVTWTRRM